MTDKKLHIGEVAQLLGITPKTIRHYESLGLLPGPPRSQGGYRLYGLPELARLQHIQRLQALGLSLRQIAFILEADQPEVILRDILRQREQALADEIAALQRQQALIQAFLQDDLPLEKLETPPPYSSLAVIRDVLPRASSLSDIIIASEEAVLNQLDAYRWSPGYEAFWNALAEQVLSVVLPHEHDVILWLERYLALAQMPPDDPQTRHWLAELQHSQARRLMNRVLCLLPREHLPADEQARMERLLPMLVLQQGSEAQQVFLTLLRS